MAQTVEYLQGKIDKDFAWRKKELVGLLRGATRASAAKSYYCRAGAVMLCAHWEGFLRKVIDLYVKHVFAQGLPILEMSDNFVAIAYYDDVVEAAKASFPGSERHHLKLARRIRQSAPVNPRWTVSTNSNPSSEVLRGLLQSVGINSELNMQAAEWTRVKTFIDSLLLGERHRVAHGDGFQVGGEVFRERFNMTLALCQRLADEVVDAARTKAYLLPAVDEPQAA